MSTITPPAIVTPPCPDWCTLDAGHPFDGIPFDEDQHGYRWVREHHAYRTPDWKVYVWVREVTSEDETVELSTPLLSVDVDVCDLPQDDAARLFADLGAALRVQSVIAGEAGL